MSNISEREMYRQAMYKEAAINPRKVIKNWGKTFGNKVRSGIEVPKDVNVSRNLEELAKNVRGSGFKTQKSVDDVVKDVTKSDFGLVGMLGGGAKSLGKAVGKKTYNVLPQGAQKTLDKNVINPAKTIGQKMSDVRQKMDSGVANFDMKAGNIGYKYAPKPMKNLFVKKHRVDLSPTQNATKAGANQFAEFKHTSISEPLRKARNVAVPLAGGMYLSDKLENLKYKPPGETTQDIDKVSYILENKNIERYASDDVPREEFNYYLRKMSKLASKASTQLMLASYENKTLMEKISQLEVEKSLIKIAYENEAKEREAKLLANEMVQKGLIKKANYEDKVKDLYKMDKQSFEIFKKTIHDVKIEKQADCKDEVDSLQFLLGESSKEKKTLAEVFENL